MPNAQETIAAIEINLARMQSMPDWTIGITSDPHLQELELDYPAFFRFWSVDTEEEAHEVQDYFAAKGMQKTSDSGRNPTHIFLY